MCSCVWFLVIFVYVCCVCVCMYWYVAFIWLNVYVCVSERCLSFLSCIDPLHIRVCLRKHVLIIQSSLLFYFFVFSLSHSRAQLKLDMLAPVVCVLWSACCLAGSTHGCLRLGHCPPPDCGVLLCCLRSSAIQPVSAVCSCVRACVGGWESCEACWCWCWRGTIVAGVNTDYA